MNKSKVYVPQIPTRYDAAHDMRIPVVDLSPATVFGEIVPMLPPKIGVAIMAPVVTALKEQLANFTDDDYLLALGDPGFIAAAAAILSRKRDRFRMLRWSRNDRAYSVVEIEL